MAAEENFLPVIFGSLLDDVINSNSTHHRYQPPGNLGNITRSASGDYIPTDSAVEDDYCDLQYGIQDQTVRSLIIVVYSLTILLSVVSNIVVIIVLGFAARAKTDLNHFLVNLAVADLLSAVVCMPFTFVYIMNEDWVFGSVACPLVFFIQQVCSGNSDN